jgi:hypothetical protein
MDQYKPCWRDEQRSQEMSIGLFGFTLLATAVKRKA